MKRIDTQATQNPWAWIPTLYFAEGLPYVIAMSVSVIMYKKMGISNADIALYTSWLYLPWVIKPLWSPIVDLLRTKRFWIVTMQLVVGAALACVALTIHLPNFFQITIAILWLMAFSGATHDIAADGFYMLALDEGSQAEFVGIRSVFYRVAMITGQGVLVIIAGYFETHGGLQFAWSLTFFLVAALFIALFIYHRFILPHPVIDAPKEASESLGFFSEFFATFGSFFRKKDILITLAFLLLYRFNESQLIKLITPFLLDARDKGGLGLSTAEVGVAYGTLGVLGLLFGGITGGIAIARKGLKFWLFPMMFIIHVPDLVYMFLSHAQPDNVPLVCALVGMEQFTYGFAFTAYSMYMIKISDGAYKTAHFAICTGIMAMGMMIPGMFAGRLQEWLGYRMFFSSVILSIVPALLVVSQIRLDPEFGKKKPVANA
ncbi:MAG TPA: MFS transporter [Bacteroidota bacterium]|nr:MFS transporter [Bacteroidota bacterium]